MKRHRIVLNEFSIRKRGDKMIYVTTDIHGDMERFKSIMKQIHLQSEDTLYVLGDVTDRKEHGIQIIRQLKLVPNARLLRGNHEQMMLEAVGTTGELQAINNKAMKRWMSNGGDVTLNYLKHIKKEIRKEVLSYIAELPTSYDIIVNGKRYVLAHAAPPQMFSERHPRYGNYISADEFSMWYRLRYDDYIPDDYTLIFGHTPTVWYQEIEPLRIYYDTNRIALDCGAGYPKKGSPFFRIDGRLACLRIDDGKEFYSET